VRELAMLTRAPIFLVGDLSDGGEAYANGVLDALSRVPVSNRIVFEFFEPPPAEFVGRIDASVRHWGAELSPESHDEGVRARLNKARFTNLSMEESIAAMLALGCEQLDLFFMVGLPGQTYASAVETVDAIARLFERFDTRLSAFITPMGPFIDPGSDGFEQSEAKGYRILAHTLAEHRALLEQRDWESILNYETNWMTRREIVDATYDAAERLNALKARTGRIAAGQAAAVAARMAAARFLRGALAAAGTGELDPATHQQLLGEIRAFSEATVNDKSELFPTSTFLHNFRIGGVMRLLVQEAVRGFALRRRRRADDVLAPRRTAI
jgi:hypothetical protein